MFQCISKYVTIYFIYCHETFELFAGLLFIHLFACFFAIVNNIAMNLDMPFNVQKEEFLQTVGLYRDMVIQYAYIQPSKV